MGLLNGISTGISEVFSPVATFLYGGQSEFLPLPGGPNGEPVISEIGKFYEGTLGSQGENLYKPLRNQIEAAMDPYAEGIGLFGPGAAIQYREYRGPDPESIKTPIPEVKEIFETEPSLSPKLNFLIRENQARINTVLEERSYLDFYFPNGKDKPLKRRVCFFENPKISEDRSSRYSENPIVGRNEPSRRYVGSEARRVRLDFDYTLPHVEYFWSRMGRTAQNGLVENSADAGSNLSQIKTEYAKYIKKIISDFFGNFNSTSAVISPDGAKGPSFYIQDTEQPQNHALINGTISTGMNEKITRWDIDSTQDSLMMATYYTHFVIDTVRASVIGNFGENFGPFGPPIVKFRHGTLFTEAPFIVKNYSINFSERNGYEVKTLLPRTVSFSLSLEEFRQTNGSQQGRTEGDDNKVMAAGDILSLERIRGK